MRAAISPPPPRVRYSWARIVAVLALVAAFAAGVEWPDWANWTALAAVNLTVALLFVLTGLLLARQPGQLGVAFALTLTGICRPLDFIDAWGVGPFPFYALGFARGIGALALLRYPNPALTRGHRRFLIAFAAWMLATRTAVGLVATPQWEYGSPVWLPQV